MKQQSPSQDELQKLAQTFARQEELSVMDENKILRKKLEAAEEERRELMQLIDFLQEQKKIEHNKNIELELQVNELKAKYESELELSDRLMKKNQTTLTNYIILNKENKAASVQQSLHTIEMLLSKIQ